MLVSSYSPPLRSCSSSSSAYRYIRLNSTTPSSVSQTPLLATSPDAGLPHAPKTRVRRALSTDSYGVDSGAMREITAGQKKTADQKKGSKHADIIDRWDPTGLGDASECCALAFGYQGTS
jgi:hypothetical protein